MKYKMIKAVSYDGIDKLTDIANTHSLYGEFLALPVIGTSFLFAYDDKSEKAMRSSVILDVYETETNQLHIKTLNTEYWFEKVGENIE